MWSYLRRKKYINLESKEEDIRSLDHPLIAFLAELAVLAHEKFHIDYLASVAEKLLEGDSPIPKLNEKNVNKIIDSLKLSTVTTAQIKIEAKKLLTNFLGRISKQKADPSTIAIKEVENFLADFLSQGQIAEVLEAKDYSPENIILTTNKEKQNLLHFLAKNEFKSISAKGLNTLLGNLDRVTLGNLFNAVDSAGLCFVDYGLPSDTEIKDIILHYQRLASSPRASHGNILDDIEIRTGFGTLFCHSHSKPNEEESKKFDSTKTRADITLRQRVTG